MNRKIEIRLALLFSSILYIIIFFPEGPSNNNLFWIFLLSILYVMKFFAIRNPSTLELSLTTAIIFLFMLPNIALYVEEKTDVSVFFALAIIFSEIFVLLSRGDLPIRRFDSRYRFGYAIFANRFDSIAKTIWFLLIATSSTGWLFLPESKYWSPFVFLVPYGISLIFFEYSLPRISNSEIYVSLIAYITCVSLYVIFQWSGYGRLIVGSFVLMPIFIASQYRNFGFRPWHILAISPFALMLAEFSRYGEWRDVLQAFRGSAAHHLLLTNELIADSISERFGGIERFLEQASLLFFNWLPPEIWHNKPVGIGLSAVDEWFGREGYSESFSISLGLFGEQIYYFGPGFLIGNIVILIILVAIRRMIYTLSFGLVAATTVFDISLISYMWGGCATFGSRAWFMIIPMLVLALLLKLFWRIDKAVICQPRSYQ